MIFVLIAFLQGALSSDCEMKSEFVESYDTYEFTLMPVPYPYKFLEPFLTETIIYAHHDHHHQTYYDKLNNYLDDKPDLQDSTLVELVEIAKDDTTLQKHAGGAYNHNLYWYFLTDPDCAKPSPDEGDLLDQIIEDFDSFDNFIATYDQALTDVFGSGWVWACVNTDYHIEIRTTVNQINPLMQIDSDICYPFLGCDLWEHAYYLKYMWDRAAYIDMFFESIDWDVVEMFYDNYASKLIAVPI